MNSISETDESRRRFLLYLLASGTFAGLQGCTSASSGGPNRAFELPQQMPLGRSIYEFDGDVRVNGLTATLQTVVGVGDTVQTSADSYVIFVVNKDAYILRSNSEMVFPTPEPAVQAPTTFSLNRGKALSVLASRRTAITTPNAIVGIRGTGVYLETDPERSYVCTCYGTADLATADNPAVNETIESRHHDAPRYILADPSAANRIQPAKFINHDDQELLLVETLVGRTPPYTVPRSVTRTRPVYR